MKNPLTQPGIEPATFRFVAQHLNHCATAVPIIHKETSKLTNENNIKSLKINKKEEEASLLQNLFKYSNHPFKDTS